MLSHREARLAGAGTALLRSHLLQNPAAGPPFRPKKSTYGPASRPVPHRTCRQNGGRSLLFRWRPCLQQTLLSETE